MALRSAGQREIKNSKTSIMTPQKMIPFRVIVLLMLTSFMYRNIHAQVLDSSRKTGSEVKTFYSTILGEKRKITIQTPSRMNLLDQYPVLYVLDGEAQAEMVAAQVKYLSESYKIIPELIVVGIENTNRTRDLTPTHSIIGPDGKPDTSARAFGKESGGGEKFLDFLKKELIPYVEASYPVAPYRILSGHSLGGLMAVYCLLNHPDYFNAYIAISPSLQWDDQVMLKQWKASKGKDLSGRLLYFSDANEDEAFHLNQLSLDTILQHNASSGLKFKRMFYPEEIHISEPVKAFYDGIRFVYPNWHLPYNSSAFRKTMSSRIIIDHYRELSKAYGYNVIPLLDEMNQVARFLRNDPGRIKDAIELLEMNASLHPASAETLEILGDTLVKTGDTRKALINYKKALSLAPGDAELKKKIADLSN
jgi:predicted alpha/beta superfamily hydrolase